MKEEERIQLKTEHFQKLLEVAKDFAKLKQEVDVINQQARLQYAISLLCFYKLEKHGIKPPTVDEAAELLYMLEHNSPDLEGS